MQFFVLLTMQGMALTPMGHQPIFVILLEALFAHDNDADAHVLVAEKERHQYEIEIARWFPNHHNLKVFTTQHVAYQDAIIEWVSRLNLSMDSDIIGIDAQYPLISGHTLSQFHEECETGIMVAKIRRSSFTNDRIYKDNGTTMVVYGGLFRSKVAWLTDHQDDDWIDKLAAVGQWCLNNGYVVKDSVMVTNTEEHIYAEHIFLEKKHSLFLNQCYSLWKKCLGLEERIQRLEAVCFQK